MQLTRNLNDKPRPEWPRLFSNCYKRKFIHYILTSECSIVIDIQKKLRTDEQINVSAETIRRILKKNGFKAKVKCKKPFLSKKHIQ
jgi:hypothetical protein